METGPRPLLAEVYASDYRPDGAAGYVRLENPGPASLDLSGMKLEWSDATLEFPEGASVAGGCDVYVAYQADAFLQMLTWLPDYTLTPCLGVPVLAGGGKSLRKLDPLQGHVRLLDRQGTVLDALVWGDEPAVPGWTGPGVEPLEPGLVYLRAIDEATLGPDCTGTYLTPGGNAVAWKQGTAWLTRRLMRIGQNRLPYPTFTANSAVTFVMPDSSVNAVVDFLDSAVRTLDINIYLMTQDAIGARIEAAARRGVAVRLFAEGETLRTSKPADRAIFERIAAAGAQVRAITEVANGFKRYRFDHAKYAIADGRLCLIMSDNMTHTSFPDTPQTGNRGWGVVLDSPELALHLSQVFDFDWNPESPDSLPFDPSVEAPEPVPSPQAVEIQPPEPLAQPIRPIQLEGPISVTPVLAPEHALLETHGVAGLIRSATTTLDVQQADLAFYWGYTESDSLETTPNLFLNEIVEAARRGVRVRVLMDGAYLNPGELRDNSHTQEYLRELADREHLALESRILDHASTKMLIHNKGLIIDERKVLVSSINWTENSPLNNRELGIILDHPAVAAYYGVAFERDWAGGR